MSRPACPRAWEAEAVADGRLAGADRSSFERHAATCEACAHEVEAMASLSRVMGELVAPDMTALELRRMRVKLLQQAHARRTHRQPRARTVWVLAGIAAVAGAAIIAGAAATRPLGSSRPTPSRVVASTAGPAFDFVNVEGATVTSRTEGGITRATLADGVAAFHVEHVGPSLRFLLALPDGEIEVRGTRFVVKVAGARTRSVEVADGVVVLRLRGDFERKLAAGERWTAPAPAEAPAAKTRELESPLPGPVKTIAHALALPPAPASPAPPPRADLEGSSSSATSSDAVRRNAQLAASERFGSAIAAFQAARYAQADGLLESFALEFPSDARVEDASFLRAVAHSRMGDASGAASLASAYLQSFPRGLRRREAEELARANTVVHAP
jgi:hypothetical protein